MLETPLKKQDPQRLLETNLFVAALRLIAPGNAGVFICNRILGQPPLMMVMYF